MTLSSSLTLAADSSNSNSGDQNPSFGCSCSYLYTDVHSSEARWIRPTLSTTVDYAQNGWRITMQYEVWKAKACVELKVYHLGSTFI